MGPGSSILIAIANTAKIGDRTKVPHFIYLGDCEVGCDTNIGCGTITCNYDGENKHKTIIGDRAFIGSNVNLVAPVTIADNSVIGAGSVVTKDIPANVVAVGNPCKVMREITDRDREYYYKNLKIDYDDLGIEL